MKKNEVRDMLLKIKDNLLQEIASNMKMEIGHLQEAIADMYDLADDERERQFTILLCNRDREKLELIDEALERIEEGTYGICDDCDEEISDERLIARPVTTLCIICKTKREQAEKRRGKERWEAKLWGSKSVE